MNTNSDNEFITGSITLSIGGTPVEMQMTVPTKPVKPYRMLPVLQKMTSAFINAGVEEVEREGKEISCKSGCGACCRQAVPLAEVEAYYIAELVEKMDEPRRSEVKKRFAEACRHLQEKGWFAKMENFVEMPLKEKIDVVMEYFYEDISCPFLENDSCSIHPDRPLICREYLVTSPAENCSHPTAENIDKVDFKITPSRPLLEFGRENEQRKKFVPLIRSLEWAEMYPEKFSEKTGQEWMTDYFRELVETHKTKPKPENVSTPD